MLAGPRRVLSGGSSLRFAVFRPGGVEQLAGEADVLPRDTPGVDAELATGLRYVRRALQRRETRLQAEPVRRRAGQIAELVPRRAGR